MQIIVLGAHRSGTSALTRLINMTGAYTGGEGSSIGFNEENPKGFWERQDVIDVNDAILARHQCSWDNLYHWQYGTAESYEPDAIGELKDKIKHVALELDQHRPWVTKDPRLCQTFGFWRRHLEIPVAVIAWRDPMEVAISLNTRNGFSLLHGLALWEHATIGALNSSIGMPRILVSYQEMMRNPVALTKQLHDWLEASGVAGLRMPSEQEIQAFIDPSLYRSKAAKDDQYALLNADQLSLLDYLKQGALDEHVWQISAGALEALALVRDTRQQETEKAEAMRHSEEQAARIRELEAQVETLEQQQLQQIAEPVWSPGEEQWLALLDRVTEAEQSIDRERNSLRMLKKLFRSFRS